MYDIFYHMSVSVKRSVGVVSSKEEFDAVALFSGEYLPEQPIVYKHVMGGKPKDILATTSVFPFIVSQRFISVLIEHQVTGWTTFPVTVYSKDNQWLPGYEGFAVTGRSGPIDDTKCRIEYRTSQYNPEYHYKTGIGLYFDLDTWDGSDIFNPQDTAIVIVVERVKALLERAEFKELLFTHVTDYELDIID